MPAFVLDVLRYAFLALFYLFILWALRTVAGDVTGRRARQAGRAAQPVTGAMPPTQVVVRSEDGRTLGTYRLTAPLQVGRGEACHIRLDDAYVSQAHARLYASDAAWYVEDLGSTNGTFLNRQRLTGPVEVKAGDEVRVGKTILELRR